MNRGQSQANEIDWPASLRTVAICDSQGREEEREREWKRKTVINTKKVVSNPIFTDKANGRLLCDFFMTKVDHRNKSKSAPGTGRHANEQKKRCQINRNNNCGKQIRFWYKQEESVAQHSRRQWFDANGKSIWWSGRVKTNEKKLTNPNRPETLPESGIQGDNKDLERKNRFKTKRQKSCDLYKRNGNLFSRV